MVPRVGLGEATPWEMSQVQTDNGCVFSLLQMLEGGKGGGGGPNTCDRRRGFSIALSTTTVDPTLHQEPQERRARWPAQRTHRHLRRQRC